MRPIQVWVADTRSPEFAAEAERQSRLVAAEAEFEEIMNWIESVSEFDDPR